MKRGVLGGRSLLVLKSWIRLSEPFTPARGHLVRRVEKKNARVVTDSSGQSRGRLNPTATTSARGGTRHPLSERTERTEWPSHRPPPPALTSWACKSRVKSLRQESRGEALLCEEPAKPPASASAFQGECLGGRKLRASNWREICIYYI